METRCQGESGVEEQQVSLSVLFRVLSIIARLMAPFTPFFAEFIWQSLRKVTPDVEDSVHYVLVPKANDEVIDEGVERSVQAMRSIMELTRVVRDRRGVGVKYPLRELIVINRDQQFLNDVKELEFYILSELNVRSLQVSNEKEKYGIKLKAEPNFRILGARLKGDQKKVAEYLKKDVKQEELESFLAEGKLTVLGHELTSEEVAVSYGPASADKNDSHLAYHSDAQTIVVVDMTEDESLVDEGLAREITNRIQKMRKAAVLATTDTAKAYCSATSDSRLHKVLHQFKEVIEKTTNTPIELADVPSDVTPTVTLPKELAKVKDAGEIKIALVVAGKPGTLTARNADCVTVKLGSKSLTLLLETPSVKLSSYSDLIYEIRSGLGLWDGPLKLSLPCGKIVGFGYDLLSLKGQELIVTKN